MQEDTHRRIPQRMKLEKIEVSHVALDKKNEIN